MNLKRSDKIIALIGVLIIVVALIAIVYYISTEEEEVEEETEEPVLLGYEVIREEKTVTGESKTYTLSLKNLFSRFKNGKTVKDEECFMVDVDNLQSIEFKIDYSDNSMGLLGLLGKGKLPLSKDSLYVAAVGPDGTEYQCNDPIVGSGNQTILIDDINRVISDDMIYAETYDDAMTQLKDLYETTGKGEYYGIDAYLSVKAGLYPIKRLMERFGKDTFKVEITYTYYVYSLEEVYEENNHDDNEDMEETVMSISDFYKTISSGRDMI